MKFCHLRSDSDITQYIVQEHIKIIFLNFGYRTNREQINDLLYIIYIYGGQERVSVNINQ